MDIVQDLYDQFNTEDKPVIEKKKKKLKFRRCTETVGTPAGMSKCPGCGELSADTKPICPLCGAGKIKEAKKEEPKEEGSLADVTKVNVAGEGPSIDTKQPEAPEQPGEIVADEADQIKSLKDNDTKDQVTPELVQGTYEVDGKKKVKEAVVIEADDPFQVEPKGETPQEVVTPAEVPKEEEQKVEEPKEETEEPKEEKSTEPPKKLYFGAKADQFFYFTNEGGKPKVINAEDKEIASAKEGEDLLAFIQRVVRELEVDSVGIRMVMDYLLPNVEKKAEQKEGEDKELLATPKEEGSAEEVKRPEVPLQPPHKFEAVEGDCLMTAIFESLRKK